MRRYFILTTKKCRIYAAFGVSQTPIIIRDCREIPKSFCSDDETIGLVQEIYGTKVNKGICCVFRYNNLPAKNVLPEYVCDYKKRAGLFQRSADLE